MVNLQQLLQAMTDKGASDLHITVGAPPTLRVDGSMTPLPMEKLSGPDTKKLCYSILTDNQKHKFEENAELDLSFGVKGMSRFRANIFMQRGAVAGVFRMIPFEIKTFAELGLPQSVAQIAERPRGLVLVTGPTGSGKSTTLAAMIDKINRERQDHIVTIEDPIEFLHPHRSCLVNQREVGADTYSFARALKSILRQDPDVVLVGELRDRETIEAAITIAETGHLCFGTLHTNTSVQTIHRLLDVFPPNQQPQIRAQLSFILEGILCQNLLPKAGGRGRAMCMELLIPTAAIRNLIREDKIHQLYSQMQVGQSKYGMQTFNQGLIDLLKRRQVLPEDAWLRCTDIEEFRTMLAKEGMSTTPPDRVVK